MHLGDLRMILESEINLLRNNGQTKLSFKIVNGDQVSVVSVEVDHNRIVDMLDLSIFIEQWYIDVNGKPMPFNILLSESYPIEITNYDNIRVEVLSLPESAITIEQLPNTLQTEWNNRT